MKKDRRTKVELIEDVAKLQNRLVELRCGFENLKHEMGLKEQAIMELRTKLDQIPLVEKFEQDRVGMLDEEGPARDCNWCRYGTVRNEEKTMGNGELHSFCTRYGIMDCHLVNGFADCGSFEQLEKEDLK